MKGFLRYKAISVWLIVIFAVSFVIFNYSIQAKLTGIFEQRDSIENSYKYGCTILITPTLELYDESIDYKQYLQECFTDLGEASVNISVIDLTLRNDNSGISMLADYYISGPKPKYPLISGEYPSGNQINSSGKYAVLGRNRMKYTYSQDGKKYIDIDGESYQVTGCISTGKSHYLDNDVIIFDKNYNDKFWHKMNDYIRMGMVQVVFESDEVSNVNHVAVEFQEMLSEVSGGTLEGSVISDSGNTRITTSYVPELQYRRWAWLSYVFILITTNFTFQYWLMCRKKEFAIRKTFGFSVIRIVAHFLLEALAVMIIGIVVGMVIVLMSDGLAKGFLIFNKDMFFYLVLIVAGYICLTLTLIGIYPVIRLMHGSPVGLINSKRGND